MRVLIVSWEFPPLVVGGLGRHVGQLARQLAEDLTARSWGLTDLRLFDPDGYYLRLTTS